MRLIAILRQVQRMSSFNGRHYESRLVHCLRRRGVGYCWRVVQIRMEGLGVEGLVDVLGLGWRGVLGLRRRGVLGLGRWGVLGVLEIAGFWLEGEG